MTPTIQLLLQIKDCIDEFFEESSPDIEDKEDTVVRARECLIEVRKMVCRHANTEIN